MHPQLGYQLAQDRARELQEAADSYRLASRVSHPTRSLAERWWRRLIGLPENPVPPAAKLVIFPQTLEQGLHEIGRVVEDLGPAAVSAQAAPTVRCLVIEVLRAADAAGVSDTPTRPDWSEPAIVGFRTLGALGGRLALEHEIPLDQAMSVRLGLAIADLRRLGSNASNPGGRRGGRVHQLLGRGRQIRTADVERCA